MRERQVLLDLIDRAFREQAWHEPSVLETLEGVDAASAAKRPLKPVHSI